MTKNAADKNGGVVPTLTASSRVDAVPSLGTIAHIQARAFHRLPSAQLGYDDLDALTAAVCDLSKASYRSVVVPRCTDTIEEAASVLDRLLSLDMPVVVTGAMRNPTEVGADEIARFADGGAGGAQ